jgi:hypothetical protein
MKARILFVAFAIAACSSAASNGANAPQSLPAANVDDTLRIGLGKVASTRDGGLTLIFVRQVAESRCALNVVCVWQGDAAVRLRAESRTGAVEATIHTALEPKSYEAGGYRISLLDVQPYPGATDSTRAPSVVVRVTRSD